MLLTHILAQSFVAYLAANTALYPYNQGVYHGICREEEDSQKSNYYHS